MKSQAQLLDERIQSLEYRQAQNLLAIKDQIHYTLESISPLNYLKRSIKNLVGAPDMKTDLLNGVAGLTSGYLSKKIGLFGLAKGPIRSLVQFIGRKLF